MKQNSYENKQFFLKQSTIFERKRLDSKIFLLQQQQQEEQNSVAGVLTVANYNEHVM